MELYRLAIDVGVIKDYSPGVEHAACFAVSTQICSALRSSSQLEVINKNCDYSICPCFLILNQMPSKGRALSEILPSDFLLHS